MGVGGQQRVMKKIKSSSVRNGEQKGLEPCGAGFRMAG